MGLSCVVADGTDALTVVAEWAATQSRRPRLTWQSQAPLERASRPPQLTIPLPSQKIPRGDVYLSVEVRVRRRALTLVNGQDDSREQ